MKTCCKLAVLVMWSLLAAAASSAQAADDRLDFIRGLQENGYGDMAVEYLRAIEKAPDLPPALRDVWDLEMARSLKTAAGSAFDAREYDSLMEESQRHLSKFIQEKPDHPDAMLAMAVWGDFLIQRSLKALREAAAIETKDKGRSEQLLAGARADLDTARGRLQQAEEKFKAKLAELPATPPPAPKRSARSRSIDARQRVEGYLLEAQLQLGMVDYYQAQTYSDPQSAERVALLKKASQAFDGVFQRNRGNLTGLYAHMWHGKTTEELGDLQSAMDIYDEVLASAPAPTEKGPATGLEPLFTQVEHFRFILLKKQNPRQFQTEANVWLKEYRRWRDTEGFQGIALDLVKTVLADIEKSPPAERQKSLGELLQSVNECAKVRSPYQPEFFTLRREIVQKRGGEEAEPKTFDEAVAVADGYANTATWAKAVEAYDKALAFADKLGSRDASRVAAVMDAKDRVRYMQARELFDKGELAACMALTAQIARDADGKAKTQSATAAQASALGVTAALNLYVAAHAQQQADAIEKALGELVAVAEFTEKAWPERPEADDARMARGQAKLVVGQDREAIDIFERVNPKSERYAAALYMAGMNHWRLYLIAKSKGGDPGDANAMAADRAKAVEHLTTAFETFKKQLSPDKPEPKYMADTERLLAEAFAEGGELQKAVELYEPLIESIKAQKPQTLDSDTIRTFLGAFRAYAGLQRLDKAGEVGAVLMEIGPDESQVNEALVGFAKLLNVERQKADAAVTELDSANRPDELAAARQQAEKIRVLLGGALVKLSQRQQLALGHMMFLGQTLNTIGMSDEATAALQRILKRTETDPVFAAAAAKAMSLIRTELLKVLRKQEKYDEALAQVDQLIKDNPKSLEPLMEKGRILEAWAEKDPAKFRAAVEHWTMLRKMLQAMRQKPDEYYEVMYNVANCLVREAEASKDPKLAAERANWSEKVLKAALTLNPKLNGPDMVAKYKVLLNRAIALQRRSP